MAKANEYDPINAHLPTSGWFKDYMDFTQDLEACPRFRFFTACACFGSAINNKIYIHRGDPELLPKLFPNIWVLLLAPPGRGHKTSTINMGVNALIQACPEVRILSDKLTPEALVKALSAPSEKEKIRIGPRDAVGLIKAPELSVFFGRQQYNQGLISLITDLYDFREEWVSETILRGTITLRNVCISILGASTPDWLQTMLPQDAFTGGFMSRFVICEMPITYSKRRAKPTKLSDKGWNTILESLRTLTLNEGEMKWTKDGDDYYVKMYESASPTGDIQYDAYRERNSEQTIRLAMLLALSRGKMTVSGEDMHQADKILSCLLDETKPRIQQLTTTPRMALVQTIQSYLRKRIQASRKQILNHVYRSLTHGEAQFSEAIRVLLQAGVIQITPGSPPANPIYVISSDKEMDELMQEINNLEMKEKD